MTRLWIVLAAGNCSYRRNLLMLGVVFVARSRLVIESQTRCRTRRVSDLMSEFGRAPRPSLRHLNVINRSLRMRSSLPVSLATLVKGSSSFDH